MFQIHYSVTFNVLMLDIGLQMQVVKMFTCINM